MRRYIFCALIIAAASAAKLSAQEYLVDVIDTPTANSVGMGEYSVGFRLYDRGSILTRLYYGIIMRNLTLGISFDAENVVGTGDVDPRRPYLYIKLPLYSGDQSWPAVCFGFDEQGFGRYIDAIDEYRFPPMGFFLVMTKIGLVSGLNAGAGVNADYTLRSDVEKKIKGFFNFDFMMGPEFMLLGELKSVGAEQAYGNAGIKYLLNPDLHFEFSVLNIGGEGDMQRIIRITYTGMF